MPSKKYLPETGKPQVVWLIPRKRQMRGLFSPLLWGKCILHAALVILAVYAGFYAARHQQRSFRRIGDKVVSASAGEDNHIPIEPDRSRPAPSRLSETDDKTDLTVAETEIDTFDGEQHAPPPGKRFVTDLDWKLIGTMVVASPGKSVAVIEHSKSRGQETVKEGDRTGAVRIKRILPDRIIVDDGQDELQIALMRSLPADIRQPTGRNKPTDALAAADGAQNAFKTDGSHPIYTNRPAGRSRFRHLDRQLVEKSLADPERIRRQVATKPVETYGQPAGFRVASIQAGSIFAELGLRSTDVIVGINGAAITTPDQVDLLFQSIEAGGDVTIQVKGKRRNRIIHLDIS